MVSAVPSPFLLTRLTMTRAARTGLLVIGVVATGAIALGTVARAPRAEVTVPAHQPPARAPSADLKGRPVGASGCMASACHGAPAEKTLAGTLDGTTWQSSGSCWAAADPHTAAYSLLTDKPHRPVKVTAAHIMARYAPGTSATDDARCVACHTNPALATEERFSEPHAKHLRNEGVSCEACHGNAGGWVADHTTWKGPRADVYAKTGMNPLYDLGERALACAGCHVGAPAENGLPVRDMNHDMIAAGHPRLNFEFAEYQRRLPKHWQEKDRATNTVVKHNPLKEWLIGRVAHGEAACKLLADRAERSKTDDRTPWPEFAEFNCAACHHNLRAATDPSLEAQWRKDPKLTGHLMGLPGWQPIWPMTIAAGIDQPTLDTANLKSVTSAMSVPRPKRADIATLAKQGSGTMSELRGRLIRAERIDGEFPLTGLFQSPPPRVPEWDSAVQLLYGYAALERSKEGKSPLVPEFRKALAALRTDDWPHVNWPEVETALGAIGPKR
ncbi:MAG: hypothetical protein FJ304_06310 [Planctomycetes bacterium]|nr:hypothetical protein [Planctomycetota bacterium]